MAVDQEARDLLNQVLAEMATRGDLGAWGTPRNFSMVVRQDQPPASGSSQYKVEDLQIDAGDIVLRDAGDIVATKISELTEKVTPIATDWLLLQQSDGTFRKVSATTLMSLTSQQVRDAMKLAPSGGAPSAGSVDQHLDNIPTTMVGTDNAALAVVCTEGRLAELDAGNLPTDIAAIPTTAMRGTDSASTHDAAAVVTAMMANTTDGLTLTRLLTALVAVLLGNSAPSGSDVIFDDQAGVPNITITYGSTKGQRTALVLA